MRIKRLAQGHNILLLGFEPSTSVSKTVQYGGKGVLKRLHRIVSVDELQFGFMPVSGTIYAVFILRKLLDEYHVKGKMLYVFYEHIERF